MKYCDLFVVDECVYVGVWYDVVEWVYMGLG